MSKTLSQATIDLLSRMSKLVDQGFTPEEAKEYMVDCEPEWRDSKGYSFSKSAMRASVKRLHRKLEWQRSGATVIIDNKPQFKK
jgi:hypothetical protein